MSGKKDGKIIVENIAPVKQAGTRKIIDDVHKGSIAIKETIKD
jgi:hypothetical protein